MSRPEIVMIVAADKNHVIGNDNKLPWHIPADLKHFKTLTMNHAVIMGRKTYESLGGRKLPGRHKVVLTRNPEAFSEVSDVVALEFVDIDSFLANFENHRRIFIIGGAEIYQLFMPYVDRIEMTLVFAEFEGDTKFPHMNECWECVKRYDQPTDESNTIPFAFTTWMNTGVPARRDDLQTQGRVRLIRGRGPEEGVTPEQDRATALTADTLAWMRSVGKSFMDGFDEVLIRVTKRSDYPEGGIVIGEHMATNADYTLEKGKAFLTSFEDNGGSLLRHINDEEEYEVFISKCQDVPYIVARKRDTSDPLTDYFGINRTFHEDEVPSRFAYLEVHNLKE